MLNVQLKSTIPWLKKQNGENDQLKLQNVILQGINIGAEGKTIYTFLFIDVNMKDLGKNDFKNFYKIYLYQKKYGENPCTNFLYEILSSSFVKSN